MIKVLVLDPTGLNPATWWRLYGPFNRIAKDYAGSIEVTYSDGHGLLLQHLGLFDVIVFYITLNEGITQIIQAAKNQGVKVILDCDDDVFNLDPSSPDWQDYNAQRNHLTLNFQMADEIWFSTDCLKDTYHKIGPNRYKMPNGIIPELLPERPNLNGKRVLWRGSHSQTINYFYAQDWYKEDEHWPDEWIWWGYCPPFVTRDKRNRFKSKVPPELYFSELQRTDFNYLWKPLKPCAQNDAKTSISWIEATMAGAVCVTNYAGKPEWELCAPSFDEAAQRHEALWAASKRTIEQHYNLREINKSRVNRLSELTGKNL